MKNMIAVHKDLPEALRLKIFICKHEGNPVAVLGWFSAGTIGLPLIAATGNKGLELNASYPLWWKMIEYYKQNGFVRCDLGGVNYERNPGGYIFKAGLAGETCEAKRYIGQFEACENWISFVCFKVGLFLRSIYRNTRIKLSKLLNNVRCYFSKSR
jgi:lipid II:glycine glycyltransferase (peptidoglycan interpeptide bridge formation enzyme)